MTKSVRKPRVSPRIRRALEEMCLRGRTLPDACAIAGLQVDSLERALKRPEILAYRSQLLGVVRSRATAGVLATAEELLRGADSERVRASMVEYLGSLDPETAPVSRSVVTHEGLRAPVGPGLSIIFLPPTPHPPMIEATARVVHHDNLPEPVPHPMMRRQAERLSAQHEPETED